MGRDAFGAVLSEKDRGLPCSGRLHGSPLVHVTGGIGVVGDQVCHCLVVQGLPVCT